MTLFHYNLHPEDIPPLLYRVQYPESVTTYADDGGLEAPGIDTCHPESPPGLNRIIERHLNWDIEYEETIFISLFASREQAEDWMLARHAHFQCEDCSLLEIDGAELRDYVVFSAQYLVETLSLTISDAAWENVGDEGEFLIVEYIPPYAINSCETIHDIQSGRITHPLSPLLFG